MDNTTNVPLPDETTLWEEVGNDWRTGVFILVGVRKLIRYLILSNIYHLGDIMGPRETNRRGKWYTVESF